MATSDEDELELAQTNGNNNIIQKTTIKRARQQNLDNNNDNTASTLYNNHQISSSFDYVDPLENIKTAIKIGYKKSESTSLKSFNGGRIIMKSMMSGAYLGFTITLSMYATSLEWDKVSAGLLFPMGFVMLILMGNDLATGILSLFLQILIT